MIIEIRDEVVSLSGSLERNQWLTLKSAVNVRLRHHPSGIVVDCGGLERISAEGAGTFRDAAAHLKASGARFVVANVPAPIMRVLRQVPNLGSQLPIAATVAEARTSLGLETPSRHHAGDSPRNIVVGLLGTPADGHAVAVACRLGSQNTGGVAGSFIPSALFLCYLLSVPRNVPLLSALGQEEEAARGALDLLDAAVRQTGLRALPRVERTRDPAARLLEVAAEVQAETIVLAAPAEPTEETIRLIETVLYGANCDVVINRLRPGEETPPLIAPLALKRSATEGAGAAGAAQEAH